MKIKTTKTFANTIQKELNKIDKFKNYYISQVKMTERQFAWLVDIDSWKHEDADFDFVTGLFSAIKIEYPLNYYANANYLTTKDLVNIYKESDKTFDGFVKAFCDAIEI